MIKNITVGIHQPNFFPWLGYFNKITKSDIFIFLDSVQYPKSSSWGNRVKFLIAGEAKWVTIPLNRQFTGTKKINDMQFDQEFNWRSKIIKNISFNYKNHPYFKTYEGLIYDLTNFRSNNLSEFNINLIKRLIKILDINNTKFYKSSSFNLDSSSNQLLVELINKVGGNIYLSGGGDSSYLNQSYFLKNKIFVKKQNYYHPIYEQYKNKSFEKGLSIFDAIFNVE